MHCDACDRDFKRGPGYTKHCTSAEHQRNSLILLNSATLAAPAAPSTSTALDAAPELQRGDELSTSDPSKFQPIDLWSLILTDPEGPSLRVDEHGLILVRKKISKGGPVVWLSMEFGEAREYIGQIAVGLMQSIDKVDKVDKVVIDDEFINAVCLLAEAKSDN
jgi:hypothetical protein